MSDTLKLSDKPVRIGIAGPEIRLDQFLKWSGAAPTGGQAKALVQEGRVKVNGRQELRRGRKIHPGDVVTVALLPLTATNVPPTGGADVRGRARLVFEVGEDAGDDT